MPHGFPHIPNFGPDLTQLLAQQQRFNRLGPIRAGEQIGAGLAGGSQSLARALQLLGQREFAAGEAEKQRTFTGDLAKQRRDAIEAASQRTAEATREAAELGARTRTTLEAERTKKQDLLEKASIKREQFRLEKAQEAARLSQELDREKIQAIERGNRAVADAQAETRRDRRTASTRQYALALAGLKIKITDTKNAAARQAELDFQRTRDASFRRARTGLEALARQLNLDLGRLSALRSRIDKEANPTKKAALEDEFTTLNNEVFAETGSFARFQLANDALVGESGALPAAGATTGRPARTSGAADTSGLDDILDEVKAIAGGGD